MFTLYISFIYVYFLQENKELQRKLAAQSSSTGLRINQVMLMSNNDILSKVYITLEWPEASKDSILKQCYVILWPYKDTICFNHFSSLRKPLAKGGGTKYGCSTRENRLRF